MKIFLYLQTYTQQVEQLLDNLEDKDIEVSQSLNEHYDLVIATSSDIKGLRRKLSNLTYEKIVIWNIDNKSESKLSINPTIKRQLMSLIKSRKLVKESIKPELWSLQSDDSIDKNSKMLPFLLSRVEDIEEIEKLGRIALIGNSSNSIIQLAKNVCAETGFELFYFPYNATEADELLRFHLRTTIAALVLEPPTNPTFNSISLHLITSLDAILLRVINSTKSGSALSSMYLSKSTILQSIATPPSLNKCELFIALVLEW